MQAFPWHTSGSTVMYFRQSTLAQPYYLKNGNSRKRLAGCGFFISSPQDILAFLGESLYNFHHGNQGGVAIGGEDNVPPEERIPEISRESNICSSKLIISRASPSHPACAFSCSRTPARQFLLFSSSRAQQSLTSPSSTSGIPRRAVTSSSDNSPSTHGTAPPASCHSTRRFFSAETPHIASGRAASAPSHLQSPTA